MSVRGSLRRACAWMLTTAVVAAGLVLGQGPPAGAEEDTRAVVTIVGSSVLEGDAGTTPLHFTISLSRAVDTDIHLSWSAQAAQSGGARHGVDYGGDRYGWTRIPSGELTTDVPIDIVGDELAETDEPLTLHVTITDGVSQARVDDPDATGTIVDDDPGGEPEPAIPTATVADAEVVEGTGSAFTVMPFELVLSHAVPWSVEVTYQTVTRGLEDVAMSGEDYQWRYATAIVPAGATSTPLPVNIVADDRDEPDETMAIHLYEGDEGATYDERGANGTIRDDDPPKPQLTIAHASAVEGNDELAPVTFDVSLSHPASTDVTFDWATGDVDQSGWAEPDADFVAASGQGTIPAGQTSATFTVDAIGDRVDEADEVFLVRVLRASGASVEDGTGALGTILDDDEPAPQPAVTVDDAVGREPDEMLAFTVTLSGPAPQRTWIGYEVTGGTASSDDLVSLVGETWIEAGESSGALFIDVVDDDTFEQDETVEVTLAASHGALTRQQAVGTIVDDDAPQVYVSGGFVPEGIGTSVIPFRSVEPVPAPVTITYETREGSAGTDDFVPVSGTVTMAEGETLVGIPISITDDGVDEPDETFDIVVTSVTNAELIDGEGTITIEDDDAPPVVPDVSVAPSEAYEDDGEIAFTITLSEPTTVPVEVTYSTGDSTSSNGARHARDFRFTAGTVQIPAGATTAVISVPLIDDLVPELDEGFRFLLQSATGATIVTPRVNGTIHDDDPVRLGSVL